MSKLTYVINGYGIFQSLNKDNIIQFTYDIKTMNDTNM